MNESVRRLVQKSDQQLRSAVRDLSQAVVAERSGLTPTLVSRLLSGKDGDDDDSGALQRVLSILSACNLTVVPATYRSVDPEELRAMQVLAGKRIEDTQASGFGELP